MCVCVVCIDVKEKWEEREVGVGEGVRDGNKIALITRSLSYALVKQREFNAVRLATGCVRGEGERGAFQTYINIIKLRPLSSPSHFHIPLASFSRGIDPRSETRRDITH